MDPEPLQSYETTQTSSAAVSYADEPAQSEYDISEPPPMSEAGNQAAQRYFSQQKSSTPASLKPADEQPNMSVAPSPSLNYTPAPQSSTSASQPLQSIDPALGTSNQSTSSADASNMSVDPAAAPLNYTPAAPNMSVAPASPLNYTPNAPNQSFADQPNQSFAAPATPNQSFAAPATPYSANPATPNMSFAAPATPNYTPAQPQMSFAPVQIPDALKLKPTPNMSYANPPNQSVDKAAPKGAGDKSSKNAPAGQQPGSAPANGQSAQQEGGQNGAQPAGKAPAAGVALVQAAPTPHARGGGAASADPENAAVIDQIVMPVPLNLPVIVPLAPAALPNVFRPPAALNPGDLHVKPPPVPEARSSDKKPPAPDAKERAKGRRVLARVSDRYSETRRDAEIMHAELIQQGDEAVRALVDAYNGVAQQIPGILISADAQLQSSFDAATSQVISAAESADQEIVRQFNQAKRTLGRALGGGLKSVKANAESASAQITTILTTLSSGYVFTLSIASLHGKLKSLQATNAIKNWKDNFNASHPVTLVAGDEGAQAEAWQKVVPKLGDTALKTLSAATDEYQGGFDASIKQVKADIDKSIKPSLQQHADKIGKEGVQSVTNAHSTALDGLRRQTRAARDAVAGMRSSTIQQLEARRQAARTALEVEAQQAMAATRHEASTAVQTVNSSLEQSLPHYAVSVERFHTMLTDAEDVPPESLQSMADGAAPSVLASLTEARDMQAAQLDTVTANVQRSLNSRLSDLPTSLNAKVFSAANEMQTRAFETANSMNQTAENMTAGFSAVADGVTAAAQHWSTPLSKAFEDYIKANQDELDKNLEALKPKIDEGKQKFLDWVKPQGSLEIFKKPLQEAWTKVSDRLGKRISDLTNALDAGIINKIDEGGVTGALRGLTPAQGYAMRYRWNLRPGRPPLEQTLLWALNAGSDDYNAAINYLNGNTALGAKYELEASMHWYNDEEDRIKAVMKSLKPDELEQLKKLDGWESTKADVESSLTSFLGDATLDSNVFKALEDGDHFLAQALEEKEGIDNDRKSGNEDALGDRIAALSTAPDPEQYGGMELTGAQRKEGVERAFAAMQGKTLNASGQPLTQADAANVMFEYATRPIEMVRPTGDGQYETYTQTVGERQTDRIHALLHFGEDSIEARAARVVVELDRPGGAKIINLDAALYDPRLDPNNTDITPDQRKEAQAEHDQMLQLAAENYARMSMPGQSVEEAKRVLIEGLQKGHKPGSAGARLGEALINDPHPTPATAAIAMEYGMEGSGTKEELLKRFTKRMNRDELQEMRTIYDRDGRDLYAELGIFGHGTLGELSGDDRLEIERNFIGKPRNDKERYELAMFTMQQQRDETGLIGGALASGSLRESELEYNEALMKKMGGKVRFVDGVPVADKDDDYTKKFDDKGNYNGDPAAFSTAVQGAQLSAEGYAAKVDQYANFVANAIAVAGMVVAAVVTVATGGLASPLLMGAIALGTGLLAVGANYAIKGGRYGWEQAFTDIGMAAVQALTAGLGQKLSLVAKAGKLTSSAFANKLIIGSATSALNSVGQTALSEQTYEKGAGGAADELLFSLFRGAAVGGVTTTATHGLESLKIGPRLPGQNAGRMKFGDVIDESTSYTTRAAGKAVTSGVGGFVGKETELGMEAARGRYKGDMGDAFVSGVEAGMQNALQGTAEGIGEAGAKRRFNASNPPPPTPTPSTTVQPEQTTTQPEQTAAPKPLSAEPESTVPRPAPESETSTVPRPAAEPETPTATRPVAEPESTVPRPTVEPTTRAPQAEQPTAPRPTEAEAPARATPTPEVDESGIPRRPASEEGEGGRRPTPEEQRTNDILEAMLTDIHEKRQMAGGKLVDDEFERLPQPQEQALRGGEGTADRTTVSDRVAGSVRERARRAFGRLLQEALADPSQHTPLTQKTLEYLTPDQIEFVLRTGKLPQGFEFDHFLTVADFPEFAHRPDVGAALPKDVHREAAHGGDTTKPREAATMLDPEAETRPPFHVDTEAADTPDARLKPPQQQVAEGLATTGNIDNDILIGQQAELAQMQARAAAARNRGRPDAALERRINALQAGIDQLQQQMAAHPAPAEAVPELPSGTAAGIEGSRFRGDALAKPRADIGEDIHTAVGTLTKQGSTAEFASTVPQDPNLLRVKPLTGEKEVSVRIIPTDHMLPEADGVVPVARYRHNSETGEYDVLISSRAPKDAVERALAHELTEIRAAHRQEVLPDALATGGFGAAGKRAGEANLSAHDRGRIAELEVLARQVEAAMQANDSTRLLQLHEDTQRLLGHLGALEDTPGASARREAIKKALGENTEAGALVDAQVAAAKRNPFMQDVTTRTTAEEYAELLLDQLDYATRLGDQARIDRVMAKAAASAVIADGGRDESGKLRQKLRFEIGVEVDKPAGQKSASVKDKLSLSQKAYDIDTIRRLAADSSSIHNRRAKALVQVIDRVLTRPVLETIKLREANEKTGPKTAVDLAASDPDYAAVVHQRYGDRKNAQSWETFQKIFMSPATRTPEGMLKAFGLWASGKYADRLGRALTATDDAPDILARPYTEVPNPALALPTRAPDDALLTHLRGLLAQMEGANAQTQAGLYHQLNAAPFEALLQLVVRLKAEHKNTSGLAEREALSNMLGRLRAHTQASEDIGTAAAVRYAELLGAHPTTVDVWEGSGVPDVMFDVGESGRVAVIEAKGGNSELIARNHQGLGKRVQQGSREYLESLAESMMGTSNPAEIDKLSNPTYLQQMGAKLKRALDANMVDYYLVRQPYQSADGTLDLPTVAKFNIDK